MMQRLYLAILVAACAGGLLVAYNAWTHRETNGATALAGLGVTAAIWAGTTIGITLATAPTAELRWLQLSYFGILPAPIAFFCLALAYTGYDRRVPRAVVVGLFAIAAVILALVWTNPAHHWYWADVNYAADVPMGVSTTPAIGFWGFIAFGYGLLLVGSILLLRYALTAPHLYRAQTVLLLVAVAAPWAVNVPHVLQLVAADFTPAALSVSTAAIWVAMFRYRLSEVGPIALRTVFESISTGVFVLDRADRVVDVNAAGMDLFDVSEDAIGSPFRAVVPDETLADRVDGDDPDQDVVAVREPGDGDGSPASPRYYEVTVTPTDRGDKRVVVVTDVTAQQRYEQRLEEQNERLNQFASVVSHDLRNPLNVAQGRLELARRDCDSEHLDHVAGAHDRMEALIEDLLVLAREGESVIDPEPVDLARLVEQCWRTVETGDASLAVEIERESAIVADENRAKQLFENLLRNAVEHGSTSPQSQASGDAVEHGSTSPRSGASDDAAEYGGEGLTVRVGGLEDGFYVEDDGPGIPEADRDDVFEPGYSTKRGGTGFGLHIVAQIAEAHGWTVRVAEGTDGGARFEFTGVERVA